MTGARLLDVTRIASRAGQVATGVDRVELAYIDALAADVSVPVYGLCRTALGFVLLDRAGLLALGQAFAKRSFGAPDVLSRLNRQLTSAARLGQSFARRHAVARARRHRLRQLVSRLPRDLVYLNVGHSNLNASVCRAIKARKDTRIVILLHDTIPLDWPEMQRPGSVKAFAVKLKVAQEFADLVICTSQVCASDVTRHMAQLGGVPPIVVAHLGVNVPVSVPEDIPPGLMPLRPYFVILGTIEPRKNHKLLLDIWDSWDAGAPELLICGHRGWRNDAVFARLDDGVPHVREVAGLSDGALTALLKHAHGLLFPSYAEGFGLPPLEAAALGTPVLAADLPACRELLGNWAVYAGSQDCYSWKKEIKRLLQSTPDHRNKPFVPPDWASHFNIVFPII